MPATSPPAQHEGGYSLIEVTVATALVGVVTLSVMTLFATGRANVYSGKQTTQAVAVATHAVEDLSSLTIQSVYDAFAITTATSPTPATYTIDATAYTNTLIRSTDPAIVAVPPADLAAEKTPTGGEGLLTRWKQELARNRGLQKGSITVLLTPTTPATPVLNASGRANTQLLKIRIIVRWSEGPRKRSVVLDTARLQRP